jgi:hypothetical protein
MEELALPDIDWVSHNNRRGFLKDDLPPFREPGSSENNSCSDQPLGVVSYPFYPFHLLKVCGRGIPEKSRVDGSQRSRNKEPLNLHLNL